MSSALQAPTLRRGHLSFHFLLFCPFSYDIIWPMWSDVRSVHFVGICGTAMASVASAMRENGFQVTGSDQNVYTPMSTVLAAQKIEVKNGYAERNRQHEA